MNRVEPYVGSSMYPPDFNMDGTEPNESFQQEGSAFAAGLAWGDVPVSPSEEDIFGIPATAYHTDDHSHAVDMEDIWGKQNKRKRKIPIKNQKLDASDNASPRRIKSRRSHNTLEKHRQVQYNMLLPSFPVCLNCPLQCSASAFLTQCPSRTSAQYRHFFPMHAHMFVVFLSIFETKYCWTQLPEA